MISWLPCSCFTSFHSCVLKKVVCVWLRWTVTTWSHWCAWSSGYVGGYSTARKWNDYRKRAHQRGTAGFAENARLGHHNSNASIVPHEQKLIGAQLSSTGIHSFVAILAFLVEVSLTLAHIFCSRPCLQFCPLSYTHYVYFFCYLARLLLDWGPR